MAFCTDTVCAGEGVFALEAVVTVTPRGIVVYACTPAFAQATEFAMPCSASTGYHVENASPADLHKMLEVNQQLIEALKERVAAMHASLSE